MCFNVKGCKIKYKTQRDMFYLPKSWPVKIDRNNEQASPFVDDIYNNNQ